jgi:hypothetical protein
MKIEKIGTILKILHIRKIKPYAYFRSQDWDTMYQLGLDVPRDSVRNWKQAFGHFAASGLRYRRDFDKTKFLDNYLFSHKSGLKLYTFV